MKSGGFWQDILASIVHPRGRFDAARSGKSIEQLCQELLSNRGEVSGRQLGATILALYQTMDADARLGFFRYLADGLDLDADSVAEAAVAYGGHRSARNLEALLRTAEPPRQELLRRINRVPGATQALVAMRADLLRHIAEWPDLRRADLDFQHLFASWFNRGFLQMQPISWDTSASVLAKIIQYEAVHAINDWNDLRRRIQPDDRRCYGFFHPSMPNEPLVFVEIALCRGVPDSIQALLDENREPLGADAADTAVFYSISNCQKGLRGISFGSSLIKQVVADLSVEYPQLKSFVTLSPIPGLREWVESSPGELPEGTAETLARLQKEWLAGDTASLDVLREPLQALAGRYLLAAKRGDGMPLDPVARFHLGNGASLLQVHAGADLSPNGLRQSFGCMVNYAYDMKRIEARHEDFATSGTVHAAKPVSSLAKTRLSFGVGRSEAENVS